MFSYWISTSSRENIIISSQDPVALDYFAEKNILYFLSKSPYHFSTYKEVARWLNQALKTINSSSVYSIENRIFIRKVTTNEAYMRVHLSKISS
ncbi:MAG: hypothetical protein ACUVUG_07025 [Candidatus Aminicenantia bacterium]